MISFFVDYNYINMVGETQYIKNESSFYYEPWNEVNFSIIIGKTYTSLDVDLDTMRVLQVTGFNPSNNWIERRLSIPQAKRGELIIACDKGKLEVGAGIHYEHKWMTYFDAETGWICVGNPKYSGDSQTVEFANNSIAVIVKNKLFAIWIKPYFVDD